MTCSRIPRQYDVFPHDVTSSQLRSHTSQHIKRRALFAFQKLSELDPEILGDIASKARKRLGDPDSSVVCAALTLADSLLKVRLVRQ